MRRLRPRLTYANVVSTLCLFILLGGGAYAASTFQSRVTGRCGQGGEGTTISKINPDGTVACVTPVIGIFDDTKSSISDSSLPYPFQFDVHCHDTSGTKVTFTSTDTQDGTLNWLYNDGASVSASGVALDAGDSRTHSIDFTGKRLEGQFILSNSVEQVTLNIHVLDNGAGNTCQGRGTAVYFSYGF